MYAKNTQEWLDTVISSQTTQTSSRSCCIARRYKRSESTHKIRHITVTVPYFCVPLSCLFPSISNISIGRHPYSTYVSIKLIFNLILSPNTRVWLNREQKQSLILLSWFFLHGVVRLHRGLHTYIRTHSIHLWDFYIVYKNILANYWFIVNTTIVLRGKSIIKSREHAYSFLQIVNIVRKSIIVIYLTSPFGR